MIRCTNKRQHIDVQLNSNTTWSPKLSKQFYTIRYDRLELESRVHSA